MTGKCRPIDVADMEGLTTNLKIEFQAQMMTVGLLFATAGSLRIVDLGVQDATARSAACAVPGAKGVRERVEYDQL